MFYLLLRNWQLAVIGVLVTILLFGFVYVRFLRAENTTLQAEKEAVEQQLTTAKQQIVTCNGKIEEQNRAIDEWRRESEERTRRMGSEIARLRKQSEAGRQEAGNIMNTKPQAGVSSCENAVQIINQALRNVKNPR